MIRQLLIAAFTVLNLLAAAWCWQVWELAAANSASPGAIVLMIGAGFFGLMGAVGLVRLVLFATRRR